MILAIVGWRHYTNYEEFHAIIKEYWDISNYDKIISGGAQGTDSMAERFAKQYNIPFDKSKYLAKWKTYGRAAGPIRNRIIAKDADYVIIFLSEHSVGNKGMINLCMEEGTGYGIVNIK